MVGNRTLLIILCFLLITAVCLLITAVCWIRNTAKEYAITIDVSEQRLFLFDNIPFHNAKLIRTYPVSTSKYGVGNEEYSKKTPLGTHSILEKIGEAARVGTIFESRENTGRIATIYTDTTDIEEELITTRILLLKGMVPGLNEGGGVDSYTRRIYIHGTPEEGLIGNPASNGCVRMRSEDIMELFDIVPRGALVCIHQ